MAKSHPERFYDRAAPRFPQWARNAAASFVLLVCLVSLSIILNNQYGARFPTTVAQSMGAIDITRAAIDVSEFMPPLADPNEGKYRALGEYVARRYRVSQEATTSIVATAYAAGQSLKLDPLLILAVISVESRFNPIAESVMGAKGLMQIIPRFHSDKFDAVGGEKAAFEPEANIMVGAQILKEYLRRTGGVADALRLYVGSSDENDSQYADKVIAERERLNQFVRAYQPNSAHQQSGTPLIAPI